MLFLKLNKEKLTLTVICGSDHAFAAVFVIFKERSQTSVASVGEKKWGSGGGRECNWGSQL